MWTTTSKQNCFQHLILAITLLLCVALGLCIATGEVIADEPFRNWQDTSGQFGVKAQFVRLSIPNVILKKADGINIEVPIARLCNEDLEFISQKTKTPLSSLVPNANTPPKAARISELRNANIAPEIVLDSELQIALEKMKQHEYPSAIEDLRRLVRENPKSRVLRLQLAECLRLDHSPAQAIDILTKVLDEDPKDQGALEIRASLYLSMTRDLEAKQDLEKLLQLGRNNPSTFHQLAWLLAASSFDDLRDGKRALTLAERACEDTNYKNPIFLRTLAAACAECGDFAKAKHWASEAYSIAQQIASVDLAEYDTLLNHMIDEQPFRIPRVSRLTEASTAAKDEYQKKLYKVLRTIDIGLASSSNTRRESSLASLMVLGKSKRPEVISRIGNCHFNGMGTIKNPKEAVRWFQAGHEMNDIDSTYGLALCYLYGEGIELDKTKAIQLLQVAADKKHAGASAQLAFHYLQNAQAETKNPKAIDLLQIAALKRNAWGMATYGECLLQGKDVAKDIAAGKHWVTLAAQKGDISGMLLCGHYHLFGKHPDSVADDGILWLEKCSQQNNSDAKRLLGLYYYATETSDRNIKKGIELLEDSSQSGNLNAQIALGELYLFGDPSIQSIPKAIENIQAGVKAENATSIYLYAVCYLDGRGVPTDVEEGLKLLSESSRLGEPRARVLLARIEQLQREQAREAQLAAEEARRVAEAERLAEEERIRASNMQYDNSFAYQSGNDDQFAQAAAIGILAIGAAIMFGNFSDSSQDYGSDDDYQNFEEHRRHQRDYWTDRARREAEYGDHQEAARSASMAQSYGG